MSRKERLILIRNSFEKLNSVSRELVAEGAMPIIGISRQEVEEEKSLTVSREMNDSRIIDEEIDGVKSLLSFDQPRAHVEAESSVLLSRKERIQLAIDLDSFRYAPRRQFALVKVS